MDWLQNYIFPAEAEFVDDEFVRIGTELACWEMIRGGTTTFVDMYYYPDTIAEVVESCGMRALISATVIDQRSPDAESAADSIARAVERLLIEADAYYRSGDAGLPDLSWRCAMAIRTARDVYSAIGQRLRRVDCDPVAGRQYVPLAAKLRLGVGVSGGLGLREIDPVLEAAPVAGRVVAGRSFVARALQLGVDRTVRDLRERI